MDMYEVAVTKLSEQHWTICLLQEASETSTTQRVTIRGRQKGSRIQCSVRSLTLTGLF